MNAALESPRCTCPRLNPERLRAQPRWVIADDLTEPAIELVRETFAMVDAAYNPLGKYGAAWTGARWTET